MIRRHFLKGVALGAALLGSTAAYAQDESYTIGVAIPVICTHCCLPHRRVLLLDNGHGSFAG